MANIPILTYHSQNICGSGHAENDHTALFEDLRALHKAGFSVISLDSLCDWLEAEENTQSPQRAVVLTFDDGCDFDVRQLDFPGHGLQQSFQSIIHAFLEETDTAPADFHATTFVIASSEARRVIDSGSLFAKGWISDDWWRDTDASGLIAIENHGWDHNHPDLVGDRGGVFHTVDTAEQCLHQVVQAAGAIESITGRWPRYFAYPFGESSSYIRETFFPEQQEVHGCRAALGTDPGPVTHYSNRWNLPRFVCARDWNSTQQLLTLIQP